MSAKQKYNEEEDWNQVDLAACHWQTHLHVDCWEFHYFACFVRERTWYATWGIEINAEDEGWLQLLVVGIEGVDVAREGDAETGLLETADLRGWLSVPVFEGEGGMLETVR